MKDDEHQCDDTEKTTDTKSSFHLKPIFRNAFYTALVATVTYMCIPKSHIENDKRKPDSSLDTSSLEGPQIALNIPALNWNQLAFQVSQLEIHNKEVSGLTLPLLACSKHCNETSKCIAFTVCGYPPICTLYLGDAIQNLKSGIVRAPLCHSSLIDQKYDLVPDDTSWIPSNSWWSALQFSAPPSFKLDPRSGELTGGSDSDEYRKDYAGPVREALVSLGLQETEINDWSTYWGLQWTDLDAFKHPSLHTGRQLNMLPAFARHILGDKDAFHWSAARARLQFPSDTLTFLLPSFHFPDDATKFMNTKAARDKLWIVKKLKSWSGAGVRVSATTDVEALARRASEEEAVMVQEYVSKPLTLRRHKFDLRWWGLITSVDPIRIRMIPNAYPKVASSVTYSDGLEDRGNRCMHVTNGKVQSDCRKHKRRGAPRPSRFPKSIFEDSFIRWLGDARGHPVSGRGTLTPEHLVESTRLVIAKAVLMVLGTIRAQLRKSGLQSKVYQFLAFDVIYDDATFLPFLEEVNSNGYLGGGFLSVQHGTQNLRDMFKCVGVGGYVRSHYQGELNDRVNRFCALNIEKCNLETLAIIHDLEDEEQHCGNWELLYPSNIQQTDHFFKFLNKSSRDLVQDEWLAHWGYLK